MVFRYTYFYKINTINAHLLRRFNWFISKEIVQSVMPVKCFFNKMKLPLGGTPLVPDPLSGHMNTTAAAAAAASSADNKRKIQMTQSASVNQSTILNHPHHHQSGTSNINSNSSTSAAHSIASSISTNAAAVATQSTLNHNNSVTATTSSIMSTVSSATPSDSNAAVSSSSSTNNTSSQEQFSVKARQEVYVMQRVSELQRDGLWTERRLPKVQEPQRPKAHWDYLLEEMVWLAADFAQERKWKKAAAKKCARMVQKHFQDKAQAAQKAEKAQELQLKRIANFLSKEVKIFWSNVEKLVEYKQHTKLEEKRKKALDQHLSFIVDQTEKFSAQLAEGMNKTTTDAAGTSAVPSLNSSRRSSPKPSGGGAGTSAAVSDDEFSPGNASSDDDEETIAKAEAEATADVTAEVAALQKESEMELDDFLSELPKDYLQNRDKIILDEKQRQSDDDDEQAAAATSDEEFRANELSDGTDEEDTIAEQEQNENKVDHKMEIDDLNVSIN